MQQKNIDRNRGFVDPATFLLLALAVGGSAVVVHAVDENRAYAEVQQAEPEQIQAAASSEKLILGASEQR